LKSTANLLTLTASLLLTASVSVIASDLTSTELPASVVAGTHVGDSIHASMDDDDLLKAFNFLNRDVVIGRVVEWHNLNTSTHFSLTASEKYSENLLSCVKYKVETKHMNGTENVILSACKNYDGEWVTTKLPIASDSI